MRFAVHVKQNPLLSYRRLVGANQRPIQVQEQLRLECRYGLCSIEIYSVSEGEKTEGQRFDSRALGFSSSETQGQIKGARESLNGRKNIYGTKKSKERREPLGTMSYQTSSKRSPPFGTGLVRHCPQGLFSPLLFLAPIICPWVSEDEFSTAVIANLA